MGFRPHVHRLAGEHRLAGFVLNDSSGVLIEVEGSAGEVERFLGRLQGEAPPLAVIDGSPPKRAPPREGGFAILESPREGPVEAQVTPDAAMCADCLRELFDPDDRRFRYPFVNCTNCGPRFTIVRGVPYDRAFTTMAEFRMCEECLAEYGDPADRRFHAQPNACPRCGPSVRLLDANARSRPIEAGEDPIAAAAKALLDGRIVAVKGVGGFHLAARADDERAVAVLRARKQREQKPFAVMAASLEAARSLVVLGDDEQALLCSPARPIVLALRDPAARVAEAVAPRMQELGVMLPYSPVHHLLLADAGVPLVMTSANLSEEPIAYRDREALERLREIADLFVVHDRAIETRTEDSVVRVIDGPRARRKLVLRRSRGHVPAAIMLPETASRPILACGGQLKNTFCLARGERAWVGPHIGDLASYEALRSFTDGIEHFKRLLEIEPRVVAHDLHPEYMSTKYARECAGVQLVGVQHHHAHLAACLAEHGERGRAVGAIFDGSGYGPDGTVWGGELLVGDLASFTRVGSLLPSRLPGGARAIREPWRMACAWLSRSAAPGGEAPVAGERAPVPVVGAQMPEMPLVLCGRVEERAWRQVAEIARRGIGSPVTTSVGRLFDAVAALCGLRVEISYEGQAACELEASCDPTERGSYPISVESEASGIVIDPRPTVRAVSADVRAGAPVGAIASRFHTALAEASAGACMLAASAHGTEVVVLSGGAFQNRRLLESVERRLHRAGLRVLVPELLPIGDGGISYGQAAVAARRTASA